MKTQKDQKQREILELKNAIRILADNKYSLGVDELLIKRFPNERITDIFQLKECERRIESSRFKIHQAETVIEELIELLTNKDD